MVITLSSNYLEIMLSESGNLREIHNGLCGESYRISEDHLNIVTSQETLSLTGQAPVHRDVTSNQASFVFSFPGKFDITLEYTIRPERKYFERRLLFTNIQAPLTLLAIEQGRTTFEKAPGEFIPYDTFWNAPTVGFLRWDTGGIFMGIENPFFEVTANGAEVTSAFEPSLILNAGESYDTEPQFIGVYATSGVTITDHYLKTQLTHAEGRHRPRFRNPSGHIPLDRNEIRAMVEFAADYLAVNTDRFMSILYLWWYPIHGPAETPDDVKAYNKMVDTFADIDGDLVIYRILNRPELPTSSLDSYWDVAPKGSPVEQILRHAKDKGIRYGFYMGCAMGGYNGNACTLPFAPDRTDWKKMNQHGEASAENCIACDEYARWWFRVQRNTIERYDLAMWGWDPGPGNGFYCHSDQHGHVPGKGGYKGWRNATAIIRQLKEEFPHLYLQGYYGRKEYGLWGFKYFDQHESYWEQITHILVATMHPDVHADRVNADGCRYQTWWNEHFRFMPTFTSHALTHRVSDWIEDPKLPKVWDHFGWKYSLMSSLAHAGSTTACILPEDIDTVVGPEFREFYRKWTSWARENYAYARHNMSFGEQVRPGSVDGYARIIGDHGFIFLCNANPRPARITFTLGDEIGLTTQGHFTFTELYPVEGRRFFDGERGIFARGESVTATVPAYQVLLLELAVHAGEPVIAGVETTNDDLPRMLDDWQTEDGQAFVFPFHAAHEQVVLNTSFFADPRIKTLLVDATPKNLAEVTPLIPKWEQAYPYPFCWARPDRLWLIVPFIDAEQVDEVRVTINDAEAVMRCVTIQDTKVIYYTDITDNVNWGKDNLLRLTLHGLGENQFMGPYLDYPDQGLESTSRVVFDRPIDPDMPVRWDPSRVAPRIVSLHITPDPVPVGETFTVIATVDTPPEKLQGVYLSIGLAGIDLKMSYDETIGAWISRLPSSTSRVDLITDAPYCYAWPVSADGLVGKSSKAPVNWVLRAAE